jgi:flagellum-specific ATP synthase
MSAAAIPELIDALRSQVRTAAAVRRVGRVTAVTGLIVESDGPNVGLGELCALR